jgi:toxin ParE1/3/4
MKCWFHADARAEFLESVVYYESQQAGLGQRFLEAVAEAVRRIQSHPNMYRLVGQAWRQCRIPKFPFGIVYRVKNRRIEVIAVMHLHRKPGYWQNRSNRL